MMIKNVPMDHEATSGIITHYEVLEHLKQYIKIFKQCFRREGRYRLFALRNVENLEIVTHLCEFINDQVYCSAISYLLQETRGKHAISQEEEISRAERESEWTCFLIYAKKLIDEDEASINYLTEVSKHFLKGKTNTFPKKGEMRLMILHNELRRLFLTKAGGSPLENTLKFLSGYYKKEMDKSSGKFFRFPIGIHEVPIPSLGRRQDS